MAHYLITFVNDEGKKQRVQVEAKTEDKAVRYAKINPSQIDKVSKSAVIGSQDLPLETQELVVSQIRALVFSGQTINVGINYMLDKIKAIRKHKILIELQLNQGATISDLLTAMGVSKTSVALVRAGESSGRITEALDSALSHIKSEKAIKSEVSSPFTEGLFIVLLSIGMLMGLPGLIAPAMETMAGAGLDLETNFLTDMLIFINNYNAEIWYALLGTIVAFVVFNKILWGLLKNVPGFRLIRDFFILKRSVLTLMVFKPLFASGITLTKALDIIRDSMSGSANVKAINKVVEKLNAGSNFSQAINNKDDWAPLFFNSFSSFEQATYQAQLGLIDSVTEALLGELKGVSKKIAMAAGLLGKFLGFLALMMMILGYYFPSLTAST
jgi:type II secretory pathway component PulF